MEARVRTCISTRAAPAAPRYDRLYERAARIASEERPKSVKASTGAPSCMKIAPVLVEKTSSSCEGPASTRTRGRAPARPSTARSARCAPLRGTRPRSGSAAAPSNVTLAVELVEAQSLTARSAVAFGDDPCCLFAAARNTTSRPRKAAEALPRSTRAPALAAGRRRERQRRPVLVLTLRTVE
jgi:hypothetical protein